jgi:hypothetical protein
MNRAPDDPKDSAGIEALPGPVPTDVNRPAPSGETLQEELTEIRELARSLMAAVHEVRQQNARNDMVRSAIQEVRSDVRAASQAMLLAQPTVLPGVVAPAHEQRSGKCPPCDCVADGCCCFDIIISQVRAAKPQIEPADMGDVGPFINALEVQIYFTVDGTGYLWPGLASTMDLRADGLPGGPGPWVVIERPVKRVCLPKGTSVNKILRVEVREHDEGVERPIGMKDELGEALGSITLDCCVDRIFPPMPIDVSLVHGGEGRGMVQVAFYAQRVCC